MNFEENAAQDENVYDLFLAHYNSEVDLPQYFKSIVFLGVTGSGKSATCNTLTNTNFFKVSGASSSETSEVKGLITRWRGD